MADIVAVARQFFEACEAGEGWDVCKAYCTSNATFAAQSRAAHPGAIHRLDEGADRVHARWTLRAEGVRHRSRAQQRMRLCRFLRHPYRPGGPCPPTGKSTKTDYVYVMDFEATSSAR